MTEQREFRERWEDIVTLLGEIPTEALVEKALSLFLDWWERVALRGHLEFLANCLQQSQRAHEDVEDDPLREAALDLKKAEAADALWSAIVEMAADEERSCE